MPSGSSSSFSDLRVQSTGAPTIRDTSAAVSDSSSFMISRTARANWTGSGLLWWKFSANCIVSASRVETPSTSVKRQSCGLVGVVEQLHRREPALAGEQLVRLLLLARLPHQRRMQQPGLADRDRQLVDVLQRPGAHVGHRAHVRERRRDRPVRLGGGLVQRRAPQVLAERVLLVARRFLAHLRDLFLGLLKLVD